MTGILTLHVRLTIILHDDSMEGWEKSLAGSFEARSRTPGARARNASGRSARGTGRLRRLHRLGLAGGQALAPVVGDRAINDGAAVDAFPSVEDQKEIGEPLEHHEPFALRTFHRVLPGCDAQLGA